MVTAPFALLPEEAGKPIWFGLSVFLLVLLVRRAVADLPDRRLGQLTLVLLTTALIAKFVVIELVNGQTNLLLGFLMVSTIGAARGQRWFWAGALVAASAFVKPYALILLPWLAVAGRLQGLSGFTLVLAAGLALPAVQYGWTGNLDLLVGWYRTVTDTTAPNLLVRENVSVASVWAKWIGIGPTAAALASVTAAALLALPLAALAWRRRVPAPDYLDVALPMLLVALISPQGWDYVLVLGVPAYVCLLDRWSALGTPWRVATAIGFALLGFAIYDVMGRRLYFAVMEYAVVGLAAIVTAIAVVHLRYRRLA